MVEDVMHVNRMFRDDEVSEHVAAIRMLRGFEVEFEVYGTAYWDCGERHFLASGNADSLHAQMVSLIKQGKQPLSPHAHFERLLVPAGWDDELEEQVKLNCCRELCGRYPERLWEAAREVAANRFDDAGAPVVNRLCEQLENTFDVDRLRLLETIVDLLFLRHSLTLASYQRFLAWIESELSSVALDAGTRDLFSKDMYGFAYRPYGGNAHVVIDSVRRIATERRKRIMAEANALVTPIVRKRCWYNRTYKLADCRRDFKAHLQELFDDQLFSVLEEIALLPVAIDRSAYLDVLVRLQQDEDSTLLSVWEDWGRQWGIF